MVWDLALIQTVWQTNGSWWIFARSFRFGLKHRVQNDKLNHSFNDCLISISLHFSFGYCRWSAMIKYVLQKSFFLIHWLVSCISVPDADIRPPILYNYILGLFISIARLCCNLAFQMVVYLASNSSTLGKHIVACHVVDFRLLCKAIPLHKNR